MKVTTTVKKMLSDIHTPVGIFLRVRDVFRDTILLESTDHDAGNNSRSIICINAIGGLEITDINRYEMKLPGQPVHKAAHDGNAGDLINSFLSHFECEQTPETSLAQGVYGYCAFDSVQFFENLRFATKEHSQAIPLIRYRFYQYVIVIDHFRDEMRIMENHVEGIASQLPLVLSLIQNRDVPIYPFVCKGSEESNMRDEDYLAMVQQGIAHCYRGDVFQIVLSRRFQQAFSGDEFNVYRALRNVNPSPYLFFFDYGDYKIMGSSPESQIILQDGNAIMHPIAGTFKRTGNSEADEKLAAQLLEDPKENAEHTMLVDLARNDLSRVCTQVRVNQYKHIKYYSHVIHMVSEVCGKAKPGKTAFDLLANTFPQGTLSGAPKRRALQIIDALEPTSRGYYGGCIGFLGMDGSCNHAIMIRSMLSKNNTLYYQAGAGIVAHSKPESELLEVNNKLNALTQAIKMAESVQ